MIDFADQTPVKKPDPKLLLVGEDFKPHWDHKITDLDYHADRTALSSTMLRKAKKSSRAFLHHFQNGSEKETKSMKFGTLAHTAILEGSKFWERYILEPEFFGYTQKGERTSNPNCKEVKEKKQEWLLSLDPKTKIVTQEELDKLKWMLDSLVDHKEAFELLKDGMPEAVGFYRDPVTGIKCRVKLDFLSFKLNTLIDVKTTRNCEQQPFFSQVFDRDLRTDIQMAMYDEAVFQISGKRPDNRAWIALENEAPFECAVHEVDPYTEEIGKYEYRRLLNRVALGIETGNWPGVQSAIELGQPPAWIQKEYEPILGVN